MPYPNLGGYEMNYAMSYWEGW